MANKKDITFFDKVKTKFKQLIKKIDKLLKNKKAYLTTLTLCGLISMILLFSVGNLIGGAISPIDHYSKKIVELDASTNTTMGGFYAFRNWNSGFDNQELYIDGGDLYVVDGNTYNGTKVLIERYTTSFKHKKTYEIEYKEYGYEVYNQFGWNSTFKYGNLLIGKKYNYLVLCGSDYWTQAITLDAINSPAIRVIKLSKRFKELEYVDVSYKTLAATRPGGWSKMAIAESEDGSEISISTGKDGYWDKYDGSGNYGSRHQIGVQLIIKTDDMSIYKRNPIWATHTLNQHVIYDGADRVFVDLNDASPVHGLLLTKISAEGDKLTQNKQVTTPNINHYVYMNMNIGGIAVSKDNYLTAYNIMDVKSPNPTHNSSATEIRDIKVLVSPKDSISSESYEVVVHDYTSHKAEDGNDKSVTPTGGQPYIVPLNKDNFMVIWHEYYWTGGESYSYITTCYTIIDGDGKIKQKVIKDNELWLNCWSVPRYDEKTNSVYWYVDKNNAEVGKVREFVSLKVKVW